MKEVKGKYFSLGQIRRLVIVMSILALSTIVLLVFAYVQFIEIERLNKMLIECQS